MRISKIAIANMAAFESFESALPAICLVQGKNGNGKTSFLDCLKYAVDSGHDEDMIHGDAPEGEILIDFDNGLTIKCRAIRARNETIRSERQPGEKRFKVSRETIDQIAKAVSYDAMAFMELREKDQLETLLRVMPVELKDSELGDALGDAPLEPVPDQRGFSAFEKIAGWRKAFYEARTKHNTAADAQSKHAAELEKALPPPAPEGQDWNSEALALQAKKEEIERVQADEIQKLGADLAQTREDIKATASRDREAVDDEIDKKIKVLEAERLSKLRAIELLEGESLENARTEANAQGAAIKAEVAPVLEKLVTDLAVAQERARAIANAEGTRKAAEVARQEALSKKAESDKLTAAIARLDALKEDVAKRLPIKGIEIQDGRIGRLEKGKFVPFERWNTQSKAAFCLRIGVLAHGQAGFIVCDNTEHFDTEHRQALYAAATKYAENEGLQFVLAGVTDTPLTVKGLEQ